MSDKVTFIESKENNFFKECKKLKERKSRTKKEEFLIEGFRLVEEAFKAEVEIECLFLSHQIQEEKLEKYLGRYLDRVKIYRIKEALLNELSSTEEPQGVVAVAKMKKCSINSKGGFYLLCDKVQDPGNLGTIIRTGHAAGIDGIILTKGTVDIYNEKVIRSTMGSMFYIPIIQEDDGLSNTKELIAQGFSMISTSLEDSVNFFEADLSGKIIIAVGNEGNGVSKEVYDLSKVKVRIPMPGGAESLNVAIASSIVIYEKIRQNTLKK